VRAGLLSALALTGCVQDVPITHPHYVGAAFGGGTTLVAGTTTVEAVSGARVSSWVSLEGVARLDQSSWTDVADDPPCLGAIRHQHWTSIGARLWLDFVRTPLFDVGVGPSFMIGVGHDFSQTTVVPGGCVNVHYPITTTSGNGLALTPALAFGFELHHEAFGVRAWLDTGAHLALDARAPTGFLLDMLAGPLVRF
jgi:hypothetical protein